MPVSLASSYNPLAAVRSSGEVLVRFSPPAQHTHTNTHFLRGTRDTLLGDRREHMMPRLGLWSGPEVPLDKYHPLTASITERVTHLRISIFPTNSVLADCLSRAILPQTGQWSVARNNDERRSISCL